MNAARTIANPIRVGRRWLFPDGSWVHVVAGGDGDEGPVVVPEDLSDRDAHPDDELQGFEDALVAEFDALLDAGSTDVAQMTAIADSLERVRAEKATRAEADELAAEQIAELNNRIHPADPEATDDPGGGEGTEGEGDEPAETPAPEGTGPEGAAREPEPVNAAGGRVARRPASASGTARRSPRPNVPDAQPRVTITAAADLPGVPLNAEIDLTQVAVSLHDRARGLSDHSARVPVARFHLPYPAVDRVTEAMSASATVAVLDRVADNHGRDANALIAAGGWCTPSQNMYDLLALDGQTGLLDVPSVGIDRGGINVPSYVGIDSADGALWSWSEDQDATVHLVITDFDVASGVGTATNTGDNHLVVGDLVDLHVGTLADGPRTVLSVPDATHFTVDVTGVPNATNATGTATRQKSCFTIQCPTWQDYRLGAYGLCLRHGNLTDRAFPELTRRYVSLVLNAHMHRMSAINIAKIRSAANVDTVTVTAAGTDSFGEVMSAIELQEEDYRSEHKISDNVVIEALFPVWVREAIRASLSMRAGTDKDMLTVTDAEINASFTARNVRPQFLEDYQPLWNGTMRTVWPTTVEAVIYPAGGFVEGNGGTIDLGVLRDSRLNATNDFTAAWSEDFRLLARRGPKGRKINITLSTDGVTGCC